MVFVILKCFVFFLVLFLVGGKKNLFEFSNLVN